MYVKAQRNCCGRDSHLEFGEETLVLLSHFILTNVVSACILMVELCQFNHNSVWLINLVVILYFIIASWFSFLVGFILHWGVEDAEGV